MSNLLLINCRPDQRRVAHIENGIGYLAHLTTKIGAAPRAESPATTDSDSE